MDTENNVRVLQRHESDSDETDSQVYTFLQAMNTDYHVILFNSWKSVFNKKNWQTVKFDTLCSPRAQDITWQSKMMEH